MRKQALGAVLALLLSPLSHAATTPPASASSRISNVLVYPGGATIERIARVSAGSRQLQLNCLPARFDLDSLQVQADAGIAVGEISVQTLDRARSPECNNSPLDARIRELEDQLAALKAEDESQELVLGFLKSVGSDNKLPAAAITATADTLRRSSLDALQRRLQLAKRRDELQLQLGPLSAEREAQRAANPQLRSLVLNLAASRDGELRISYRSSQAGWSPVYRAYLDTARTSLRLERHAQVAQSSGEDWRGVRLRLSTVQPRQASSLNPPQPWVLDLLPPPVQNAAYEMAAPAPAMAMAPPPAPMAKRYAAPELPSFDVSELQGAYAAEYEVPGEVQVASDGQRVGFLLGSAALNTRLVTRVQPQQEAQAYLLADSERPKGSWPDGALQLFRDGAFIGQSRLTLGSDERLALFFGRDELVRVQIEPEQRNAGSTGFIASRSERRISHGYLVENLHSTAITLQLLEAAPAPRHEDIRVQTQFKPAVSEQDWHKLPGMVLWRQDLTPGQSQRFSAEYLISYPKDARIGGLR
ncbi:DUF4139 domain-containing protein [Paucibacter sp. APW11]|uniref:DUF4139 domain-containing protein n=1 Tax=Roseateles aquae TaxID=3077235 RepID=A0ABU3PBE1_9BURK|nr:DUF4139 domain-containing protein [Paucibacter sp. APW11]MDT8999555.1 DUF4139 domain-containing protein [Paucibacter sp. APW11]